MLGPKRGLRVGPGGLRERLTYDRSGAGRPLVGVLDNHPGLFLGTTLLPSCLDVRTRTWEEAMTGGNIAYLLLVVFAFLSFSGAMYYGSTQTSEAEADPNMPTGKTNPDAMRDHE
jgi:hypothetical protein